MRSAGPSVAAIWTLSPLGLALSVTESTIAHLAWAPPAIAAVVTAATANAAPIFFIRASRFLIELTRES